MARQHFRSAHRLAFTLMEMLVAFVILLLLATLIVGLGGRLMERSRTASATGQLQAWLLGAKQMALRDKLATGVQLDTIDSPGSGLYTRLYYVQQPKDLRLERQIAILTGTGT